jgi:hypothetical protein
LRWKTAGSFVGKGVKPMSESEPDPVFQFRDLLRDYRDDADRRAIAAKESNLAWELLCKLYRGFSPPERNLADQVLYEWLRSNDENLRYDALVLIDEFGIRSALQPLLQLSQRLQQSAAPSAPSESAKVTKIIGKLTASKMVSQ